MLGTMKYEPFAAFIIFQFMFCLYVTINTGVAMKFPELFYCKHTYVHAT